MPSLPKTPLFSLTFLSLLTLTACEPVAEPQPDPPPNPTKDVAPTPDVEATGTIIEIAMTMREGDENGPLRQFSPRLVRAKVGDTIRFVPSSPEHEIASIETMLPEGARGFASEPGEAASYVVPEPGIYGIQCVPHYAAGSVGIIVVEGEGMTANLEAARTADHPGRANEEFFEVFAEAERRGWLE